MLKEKFRKNKLWVSRKYHDDVLNIAKEQSKLLNENRQKLAAKNKELQRKVKELEKEIKVLKKIDDGTKTYLLRRCQRCQKYFTVEKGSRRKYCLDCKKNKKK